MSDQEEREQIQTAFSWLKTNGKYIILLITIVVGWYGGNNYYENQKRQSTLKSSVLYSEIIDQIATFTPKLKDVDQVLTTLNVKIDELKSQYPKSLYSSLAILELAKIQIRMQQLEMAETGLQWIIDNSPAQYLIYVAKYRLAKIYFGNSKYAEAKELLADNPKDFSILYSELLGDISFMEKDYRSASTFYKTASVQLPEGSKALLEIKKTKAESYIVKKSPIKTISSTPSISIEN